MPPKRLFSQINEDSDSSSSNSPPPLISSSISIEFHSLHIQSPNRQQRLAIIEQQIVPAVVECDSFIFGVEYDLFKTFSSKSVFDYYYYERINLEEEEWRVFELPTASPFKKHSHRGIKSTKIKVSFKEIERRQDSDDEEFDNMLLASQNEQMSQAVEEDEVITNDDAMIVDVQSKKYNRPQYTVFSQKKKKEAFGKVFVDLKMLRANNFSIFHYIIKYVTFCNYCNFLSLYLVSSTCTFFVPFTCTSVKCLIEKKLMILCLCGNIQIFPENLLQFPLCYKQTGK